MLKEMTELKRFAALALVLATVCLLGAGCSLPKVPTGAKVSVIVTSPPLAIGNGGGGSTQVSVAGMDRRVDQRIDPATGGLVPSPGSVVMQSSSRGVEVPQAVKELEGAAIEGITFTAGIPKSLSTASAARARGDSIYVALTITMTDPPADLAHLLPLVFVRTLRDGYNNWVVTDAERALAARLIAEADNVDIDLYLDGTTDGYVFNDFRLIASGAILNPRVGVTP